MKKILLTLVSALLTSVAVHAQKYLEVYQGKDIIGSMMSTDIDSVRITGTNADNRQINFFTAGVKKSFAVNTIDSIKVVQPLVYLGILGFNQELYTMPIDILATSTSGRYSSFVSNLMRKDGTLLYYGVDNALNYLTSYNFTTPLSSVNLITFTDGLDQGSLMMTSSYMTDAAYLGALSRRIASSRVKGLPITAYSLGLRGNDVSDYNLFQTNLRQLASSEDKAIEVTSMSDVQRRLQEIADQIISISNRQTVSVKIPGVSNGTRIRFTFDGNSPDCSTLYIEGTFNLADRSLRNVTYHGMRATSGSTILGLQEGIFFTYTFTGLQRTDGNGLIPTGYIRQYNKAATSDTWQRNSEFTPDNNTQTTITHSGAAIMLVLDCSSSLGSQFSNMQSYARDFISRVANNAEPFKVEAPTSVTAALDDNDLIIHVSWDAVKFAESYTIYRNGSEIATGVTTNSWTDETPRPGNNYYSVRAVGHGMTSSSSDNTPSINCSIATPTNVTATLGADEKTIRVTWDAVKYAESYDVYRNGTLIQEDVRATFWTDNSPICSNVYTIKAKGHGFTSELSQPSERISTIPANGLSITVNGVQFTMIKVEGGTFQMGSISGENDEKPVHQVTLTNDYYIGETEVTQELWTAVMGSNPSNFKSSNQLPVEQVSWNDCQTFITKLNALTGRTFRLPTEAEWEFAARGGNASMGYIYSGSNNVGYVAWYASNSSYETHYVATKAPNELGIYDMNGNVGEWCQDWYGRYSSEAQTNPTGPTLGSNRVIRGGSKDNGGYYCRVAIRSYDPPFLRDYDNGLRLAL